MIVVGGKGILITCLFPVNARLHAYKKKANTLHTRPQLSTSQMRRGCSLHVYVAGVWKMIQSSCFRAGVSCVSIVNARNGWMCLKIDR